MNIIQQRNLLKSIKNNDPITLSIDLRNIELTRTFLQELKAALQTNTMIGNIYWNKIPQESQELVREIEAKIANNNLNYSKYPNDYVHILLAYHAYYNSNLDDIVNVTVNERQILLQDWQVNKIFANEESGYYGVLYTNHKNYQMVLSHRGVENDFLATIDKYPDAVSFIERLYSGEMIEDILHQDLDWKTTLKGVLKGKIVKQQYDAYNATKVCVEMIIKDAKYVDYSLSVVGHSLGGWLAQQSTYFSNHIFKFEDIMGVNFDGPGASQVMKNLHSNIENHVVNIDIRDLNIKNYLSAPNLINSMGGLVGDVFRVFPELDSTEFEGGLQSATYFADNIFKLVLGNKFGIKDWLNALILTKQTHNIENMVAVFNATTGAPNKTQWVEDWPKISIKGKVDSLVKTVMRTYITLPLPDFLLNSGYNYLAKQLEDYTIISFVEMFISGVFGNINIKQLFKTIKKLEESQQSMTIAEMFGLDFEAHFQSFDSAPKERYRLITWQKPIDHKVWKIWIHQDILKNNTYLSPFIQGQLNHLLNKYSIEEQADHKRYLVADDGIESIRNMVERLLKVEPKINILLSNFIFNKEINVGDPALGRHNIFPPHKQQVLKDMPSSQPNNQSTHSLLQKIAINYRTLNQHDIALKYLKQALTIVEAKYQAIPNHLDIIDIVHEIGETYEYLGLYTDSLDYYIRELGMKQTLHKSEGIDTTLDHLGIISRYLHHDNKALEYDTQALKIRRALHDNIDMHPDIAQSLHNIAIDYRALGQHQVALNRDKLTHTIRQKLYGDEHIHTANSLHNIGINYRNLGQYGTATQYHKDALEIRKMAQDHHLDTVSIIDELAISYEKLGAHENAIYFYYESLKIQQMLYKQKHPSIAFLFERIGINFSALKKHQDALEAHQKALEIRKVLYGAIHAEVANSLEKIGMAYLSLKQYTDADTFVFKAFELRKAIYGMQHIEIAKSFDSIGTYYLYAQRRYVDTQAYYTKALELRKKAFGEKDEETLYSEYYIGFVHYYKAEYDKALTYFQKILLDTRNPILINAINDIYHTLISFYQATADNHRDKTEQLKFLTILKALKAEQQKYGMSATPNMNKAEILQYPINLDLFTKDKIDHLFHNAGAIYNNINKYEATKQFHIDSNVSIQILCNIMQLLNQLGINFHHLGQQEEALKSLAEGLTVYILDDRLSTLKEASGISSLLQNMQYIIAEMQNNPDFSNAIQQIGQALFDTIITLKAELALFQFILEQFSPNLRAPNSDSHATYLHYLATTNSIESLALLLQKGVDPNTKNIVGDTPLHYAAYHHNLESINALIAHNVDLETTNNFGISPLQYAILQPGDAQIITTLVHGLKNAASLDRYNAVHTAASMGNAEALHILLEENFDITMKDKILGWRPIDYARLAQQQSIITIINQSQQDGSRTTKLNSLTLKKLVDSMADVICGNNNIQTTPGPLSMADKTFLAFGIAYASKKILNAKITPFHEKILYNIHDEVVTIITQALSPYKEQICSVPVQNKVTSFNEAAHFLSYKAQSYMALDMCEPHDTGLYTFNELNLRWVICEEKFNILSLQSEVII